MFETRIKIQTSLARLPENSRNIFVDLQSQNGNKKTTKKLIIFIKNRDVKFRLRKGIT